MMFKSKPNVESKVNHHQIKAAQKQQRMEEKTKIKQELKQVKKILKMQENKGETNRSK